MSFAFSKSKRGARALGVIIMLGLLFLTHRPLAHWIILEVHHWLLGLRCAHGSAAGVLGNGAFLGAVAMPGFLKTGADSAGMPGAQPELVEGRLLPAIAGAILVEHNAID